MNENIVTRKFLTQKFCEQRITVYGSISVWARRFAVLSIFCRLHDIQNTTN